MKRTASFHVALNQRGFVSIGRSEGKLAHSTHSVSKSVNDRVNVAGLLVVFGVIVPITNTKRAENGTKLSKTMFFSRLIDESCLG